MQIIEAAGDAGPLIGLAEAAKLLRGRGGNPPTIKTVRGWIKEGYRPMGYAGAPVVLKAVLVGRDYCTTVAWVEQFERARFEAGRVRPAPLARPRRTRLADRRRADEYLRKAGVKA